MKQFTKVTVTLAIIAFVLLMYLRLDFGSCQSDVTIKIVSLDDANSLSVGDSTSSIPKGGIPFTVKVILEGYVSDLMSYQVGVEFDYPSINCTGVWIPAGDSNFIFYGKTYVSAKDIGKGTVDLGAALLDPSQTITTSGGLLCMINFTGNKIGTFTLRFLDSDHTFLLNSYGNDILPYDQIQKGNFTLNVLGAKSPPIASFTYTPDRVKANKTVTFDASDSYDPDGYIVEYIWDFGDGYNLTTTQNSTTHKFTKNGVYDVNLTVVDNDNLADSFIQTIRVGSPPQVVVQTSNPPFKQNEEITFNASLSYDPDGQIVTYIWDFGDGYNITTTENFLLHSYENRGLYLFKLVVVDDDGLLNSTSLKIQIGNPPVANFTFNPQNPTVWETVSFDATGSYSVDPVPITSFVWYFEDSNENITTSDPFVEHVFVSADVDPGYNVTLTVYDSDGLHSSYSVIIPVVATVAASNVFGSETLAAIAIVIVIAVVAVIIKIKSPKEEALEI